MTKTCWVVCDQGKIGTQNQCVGLAEGLGFKDPLVKHVTPRFPWTLLPAHLWFSPLKGLTKETLLSPPWPQLIVAAGRASVAPTAAIRRLTKGRTRVIQLQNPRVSPELFDAVIAPRHDGLQGPSVIQTEGALHRVTPERLKEEAKKFEPLLKPLKKPLTTVLLGGTNACYKLEHTEAQKIISDLRKVAYQTGGSLAVTLSRRTSKELQVLIRKGLEGIPHVFWGGEGNNPYFAFLEAATQIIVTCDSVSMTSEACATGKPVFIYQLPGGSKKFRRFHDFFTAQGYTRPFSTSSLEAWTYPPLVELPTVLKKLRQRLDTL